MQVPFGLIEGDLLEMQFSTADYSIASIIAAVREHLDKLEEMDVHFLGAETNVPEGNTPVFKPVCIKAVFQYVGNLDQKSTLERAYRVIWQGIVSTFPCEKDWAVSKQAFGHFIVSQADLLRARNESAGQP
ncbi:MAG: hypothetical protein ACYTFG_20340 [Planctomycetota bacterium]|jgi:hypothetical protein